MLNVSLGALNWMFSGEKSCAVPATATNLHKQVFSTICSKLVQIGESLDNSDAVSVSSGAFKRLVSSGKSDSFPLLKADLVDMLPKSGTVDPCKFISEHHADIVSDPCLLFPDGFHSLPAKPCTYTGPRREYVRLVSRQLRSGKVVLANSAFATATVFAVGKKQNDKQREVWNGARITEMALPPPAPPLLANPAALGELCSSDDRPLFASGRDARVFFDQMRVGEAMQDAFGRPPLHIGELLDPELGSEYVFTMESLEAFCRPDVFLDASSEVTPLCATWPMGFGWSSFLAQSIMSSCAMEAGLAEGQFLCEERVPSFPDMPTISVATDDVLLFQRLPQGTDLSQEAKPLDALDAVFRKLGIIPHEGKAFDLSPDCTALGIQLQAGKWLVPKGVRMKQILATVIDVAHFLTASPGEIASLIGVITWNNLLARPLLSCLHCAYGMANSADQATVQNVSSRVISELVLNICMVAFWAVDLKRTWLPLIATSDASQAYGYGFTMCPSTIETVRSMAHHTAKWPHHVRLADSDLANTSRRDGPCFVLPHARAEFRKIFGVKAKCKAHAGLLEARAATLGLQRIVRKARNHRSRVLFGIDAQAVLHSFKKGRSSACTFRKAVARHGAVALAADVRAYYAYFPSEENPSDGPSRGIHRCGLATRHMHRKPCSEELCYNRLRRLMSRRGLLSRSSDYSCNWSCASTSCTL